MSMDVLDVLSDAPPARAPSRRLRDALTFAFARGESEERLLELASPPLPESTFRQECFAKDLFLDELIAGSFTIEVRSRRYEPTRGYLRGVLVHPPGRSSTLLRQGILRELEQDPELVARLENAYLSLLELRRALSGADAIGGRVSHLRRRLDILTQLRKAVQELERLGAGAKSELRRVADFTRILAAGEAYGRVLRLLDFEDSRTVLESRLSLGYDGTLRRFEIMRVTQADHASFPRGRLGRFLRSLVGLLKGYRFSEDDIMSQVLDQLFGDLEDAVAELLGCSVQLEFYLASLGFRRLARARGYEVSLPTFVADPPSGSSDLPEQRRLDGLFNPWLVMQGVSAVSFDDVQGDGRSTLILTGPNSGGKTRYLQALAVSQLLAQAGTYVPARTAQLIWVEQMFLSLLESASAAQDEGRLGMELLRIRHVFETSGPNSLIVMDELCSGTNPSEGEQIFDMVLGLFAELRPQVLISTHFLDFAARLADEKRPHLYFRQVELGPHDVPTYQFVPGVARTSLARNTATRLGVTQAELLALVEAHKRSG
jgi:DNA mismatch repair protein MutS2